MYNRLFRPKWSVTHVSQRTLIFRFQLFDFSSACHNFGIRFVTNLVTHLTAGGSRSVI
jgi:hypothetical protein